eukprot:GHVO01006414.1.p1 GENE.GHVO01006414.1~~GHVO01006414.1.p1  ORF type:complete len:158 (+),score=25.58 GHVO01006414.1:140-613(+)
MICPPCFFVLFVSVCMCTVVGGMGGGGGGLAFFPHFNFNFALHVCVTFIGQGSSHVVGHGEATITSFLLSLTVWVWGTPTHLHFDMRGWRGWGNEILKVLSASIPPPTLALSYRSSEGSYNPSRSGHSFGYRDVSSKSSYLGGGVTPVYLCYILWGD